MDIVYITPRGILKTRPELAPTSYAWFLSRCNNNTPIALTTQETDKDALQQIYKARKTFISISDDALAAIELALTESKKPVPPICIPTDYERIGHTDKMDTIKAIKTSYSPHFMITEGREYPIKHCDVRYQSTFTRNKMHVTADGTDVYSKDHTIQLKGVDVAVRIADDNNAFTFFRQNNDPGAVNERNEMELWDYFEKPEVDTVKELFPDRYQSCMDILAIHEAFHNFKFYDGQADFISRVGCLSSGLVAAETGCGKTLMAISLCLIMGAKRIIITAPKGTVKSGGEEITYDPAQWVKEFSKFAPELPVYTIFNEAEYNSLRNRKGGMPEGVFITFPSALFTNEGALEYIPTGNGWNGANTEEKFRKKLGLPYDDDNPPGRHDYLSAGVGEHNDGIHCLAKPSLATKMGNIFDMIIVDEAHLIARLSSQTTKSMIRLQPKFRFALTATPIPNMIYNIFAMLGWLSVKDWYAGGRRNARWPYAIGEMDKFKASFVSKEKDLTEDLIRMEAGKNAAPAKDSPVISQKPRLLKLLKRTLAHVSKISCNPELPECEVLDIRVPMGGQQHKDYAKYIDPTNVPAPSPMVVMAKQQQWLRGICAAPAGLKYTTAESNFNPKTIATLEVISKCLERGEQVVHVVARTAQNDEIQRRLEEANIPCSRIDSTVRNPAAEANRFKAGKTKVMLMGIKCAQGYSFENARNLIIGSLEWSYGAFNQAQGRIYRLTSDKKCTVYVILHENSIEELLFDKLGQKEDAATLCLYGKNVPREYKTVNASEIMASHWKNRNKIQNATQLDESFCEQKWDKLKKTLELANM